jgi:hypothetical protein
MLTFFCWNFFLWIIHMYRMGHGDENDAHNFSCDHSSCKQSDYLWLLSEIVVRINDKSGMLKFFCRNVLIFVFIKWAIKKKLVVVSFHAIIKVAEKGDHLWLLSDSRVRLTVNLYKYDEFVPRKTVVPFGSQRIEKVEYSIGLLTGKNLLKLFS